MKLISKALMLLAVFGCWSGVLAADFTQADLEKMVRELESVMPEDPKLLYPIKCSVVDKKEVNAYVTAIKEGDKYRATMVVFSGLVDFAGGDLKMVRAVVAHEVAHLSRGHVRGPAPAAADAGNLWTRQQEFDADIIGAAAMQRLGYSKDDVVAMLLKLDTLNNRTGSWWEHISSDHADPKDRAAQIASDPRVLKALMSFDVGLAFMDNRKWSLAMRFFEEAQAKEPQLLEAQINAAHCSLMIYYDLLGFGLRESWLRPDFGPMLVRSSITPRGDEASDADRERYKTLLKRVEDVVAATGSPRSKELLALVQVLEPDANKAIVTLGVEAFKAMVSSSSDEIAKLRFANNLCVGYHRLGNLDAGYLALIDAQRKTKYFNSALAENLGRITVKERSKEDEQLAVNVMFTWLKRSQSLAPYWATVSKNYAAACGRLNLKPNDIQPLPVAYCKAIALRVDGREYGLFRPIEEFRDGLGTPDAILSFSERYPDLTEMRFKSGRVTIFTERGKAMRITTYDAGSTLFLQPADRSVSGGFNVRVGMSVADLTKFLDPASGEETELAKGGDLETWTYWPGLNLGLLIADGKVAGITVTPVE